MKRSEILNRAKKAVNESKAKYKLGFGGINPLNPLPESKDGFCDCSGFISWCLGESRKTSNAFLKNVNGGWIETTGVVKDAKSPDGMFTQVDTPLPGDLIVYGDVGNGQGHIGIISEVESGKAKKVIHCGTGASRRTGRAIEESEGIVSYFYTRNAIHVRFDKTEEDITAASKVTFLKNLNAGETSEDVLRLQTVLRAVGVFPSAQPLTGYYGTITANAVAAFQKQFGIPNGETEGRAVGPKTRAALNSL